MTYLCNIADIPTDGCKGFDHDDESLFVVERDGQYYGYRNRCPHLGVELNWLEDQFLDLDGALIQCATHGALFIIENGECVAGPCQGQALEAIPLTCRDGALYIAR